MQRRHQVNHAYTKKVAKASSRGPVLIWASSLACAIVLAGGMAWPALTQPPDLRQGTMSSSLGSISAQNYPETTIFVSADAPLAALLGSGESVEIDGRTKAMRQASGRGDSQDTGNFVSDQGGPNTVEGSDFATLPHQTDAKKTLLGKQTRQVNTLATGAKILNFIRPVDTLRISSPFGWRGNPTGPGSQLHIGQDYPIACGSAVRASEAGIVTVAGWAGHSGLRVTLDHGNNIQTGYSHNSKLIARVGDYVTQGQLIALSGTTGNSTGCHVHFEILANGHWLDPSKYLPGGSGQLTGGSGVIARNNGDEPADKATPSALPPVQAPTPKPTTATSQRPTPTATHKPDPTIKPKPTLKPSASPGGSVKPKPTTEATGDPSPTAATSTRPTQTAKETPTQTPAPTPSESQGSTATPTIKPSVSPSVSASVAQTPTASKAPIEPTATDESEQETAQSTEATANTTLQTTPTVSGQAECTEKSQPTTFSTNKELVQDQSLKPENAQGQVTDEPE